MPCDARKTPYLVEKHGDGKKNVSKPGISIIKCISMRKKPLFADPNFVSGDLFTGARVAWEKIQLGALKWPSIKWSLTVLLLLSIGVACVESQCANSFVVVVLILSF